MKKIIVLVTVVAVMLIGATVAFAADVFKTPAEIVSDITGKTEDEVAKARQDGVTYGAQAAAAGKLDEFQDARLEQYKLRLDEAVKDGRITQEEADKLYAAMQARMAECDGTGSGAGCGLRMGRQSGQGRGAGLGMGRGSGIGRGGCSSFIASNN